jgi:pullulanase
MRLTHTLLIVALLLAGPLSVVRADDTPPPSMVVIPGTIQKVLGCPGDWNTDCPQTELTYNRARDVWEGTFEIPAGRYEYKVALNGTWAENYGLEGLRDGPNIPLAVPETMLVTFTYDHKTHTVIDSINAPEGVAGPIEVPQPELVVIPGTHQSELGCPGDWMPDCRATALTYDEGDGVWQGTFLIEPGNDQDGRGPRYKVALDGTWDKNFGLNARPGGDDIPLVVEAPTQVKFYYHHRTNWVTDNHNAVIAVAMGDFQTELGCARNYDPGCLRTWLMDPTGSGTLAFIGRGIPPGSYEVLIALNESDSETIGQDGQRGGPAIPLTVTDESEVYIAYSPSTGEVIVSTEGAPRGDIRRLRAHWVTRDTIAWRQDAIPGAEYRLYHSPDGSLALTPTGVVGGEFIPLTRSDIGLPARITSRRPHLQGQAVFKLEPADLGRVPDILRGQIVVAAVNAEGRLLDATSLQIPGVLDDVYTYDGPLGVTLDGATPTLRVWAPTARNVRLLRFADSRADDGTRHDMTFDAASGVWSVTGAPDWAGQYYLYEVEVYVPHAGHVVTNLVTDPYSFSLSMNSRRSQIVDLNDPALKPGGWDNLAKPPLEAPEDIVVYELHVRDFSIGDASVPEADRGTFRAFTHTNSAGMRHLRSLAQAGLTHIHLLPVFDIASIDEDRSTWRAVDEAGLSAMPPDSDGQYQAVNLVKEQDGFNWGYDPYHFTVPEGSYSSDPDGTARVLEFRQMVQALNRAGLRVVMDVVYNHTHASGQAEKSVFDRIVPGYYHRLSADGLVETSTCCQNTATERAMMQKLMVDSLLTWSTAYKVDGYRFDLMGHHMLQNMVDVRAALDGLTPESHGVDGSRIYVYGEGWDFGEVANNARGRNASQLNIGGTGIGVFSDRLRDAARGGSPFGAPQEQGFLTGLYYDPSGFDQGSEQQQRATLLRYMDLIRVGLAGSLKDYRFMTAGGRMAPASQIDYNGSPAGYTLDPQENIIYVSAHDNETLFDAIQLKAPQGASMGDRVRMLNLGNSVVMLSQGVPFFHAGDELLRSKSLDRNSYNSGDWFNRLDFTYQTNNWGVGLPPNGSEHYDYFRSLLADPALKPGPADIQAGRSHFLELLSIRQSSRLFRLQTAEDVINRLTFYNLGPDQIPGLIVMHLDNSGPERFEDPFDRIAVIFNATTAPQSFGDSAFSGAAFALHPAQRNASDAVVRTATFDQDSGTFNVPARTTAVFVVASPEAASAAAWRNAGLVAAGLLGLGVIGLGAFALSRRRPRPTG